MSLSFWILLAVIAGVCIAVFTKTVSNDVKNDYRIRDILTGSQDSEDVRVPIKSVAEPKQEEQQGVPAGNYQEENIYEEMMKEQRKNYSYSTNTYSTNAHEEPQIEKDTYSKPDSEPVYYEKINDDACDPDYDDEDIESDYSEDLPNQKNGYGKKMKMYDFAVTKPSKSLFDYVRTFWKGITFAIGMLVCIYSFIGIATQVQTSNDAIVYSLWLLIGVILIK